MTCVCAEVSPRDYRAWYGLGQTYEILKMPYYCLYYYKRAQMLRFVGSGVLKLLLVAFRCLSGTFQRISIMLTNDCDCYSWQLYVNNKCSQTTASQSYE